MKIKILCLITVFMFILYGSVFAQNAQELRIGSSLSGNITAGQEIWYGVAAAQDGLLVVQTTGDTDTFLEAYDAGGNFISENDDGPNEYNASVILSVKHGNNYFFRLTGYDESVSGPYRISASYFALTQLNAGGSHSGNITDWDYKYFIFTAPRTGSLTIETSGSTDTYLCLYDENLEFLDYDDDGAEFPNDRIVHQVTSGKTYYIELGVYELGPYTISARLQ